MVLRRYEFLFSFVERSRAYLHCLQARSQDFSWGGGGGGGGCVPQEPGPNNECLTMQLPKTRGGRVTNLQNRATFNGTGNFCEGRRREPLGGSGGMPPPQKIFKPESLKHHSQHYQANSCIKNVPKIDRYFLVNFQ